MPTAAPPPPGSGVASAFPGGQAAHPEDQNEEENEENLRKNGRTYRKKRKDLGNVCILPTREWEAGYGPAPDCCTPIINQKVYYCFKLFLKIISTFLKKKEKKRIMQLEANCPRNFKNGIEMLVNWAILKLWIKTVKILFWSITQKLLGLLKF